MNASALMNSIRARAETRLGIAPGIQAVLLGGSRAQGTERPDSDWDLAVLIDESSAEFELHGALEVESSRIQVELRARTRKNWLAALESGDLEWITKTAWGRPLVDSETSDLRELRSIALERWRALSDQLEAALCSIPGPELLALIRIAATETRALLTSPTPNLPRYAREGRFAEFLAEFLAYSGFLARRSATPYDVLLTAPRSARFLDPRKYGSQMPEAYRVFLESSPPDWERRFEHLGTAFRAWTGESLWISHDRPADAAWISL